MDKKTEALKLARNECEYTIEFNTQGGSSILGRLLRFLWFPFAWILTGKAKL